MRWRLLGTILTICGILVPLALPAFAHPLGNFSINRYTAIDAASDALVIQYVVDLAEVPTFQEVGSLTGEEMERHLAGRVDEWVQGLRLAADGASVPLTRLAARVACLSGAGGLPVLRMEADLLARPAAIAGDVRFIYRDTNFPGRAGWKEIVVSGPAVHDSSVPAVDRGSNRLRAYPEKLLNNPPDTAEAAFGARVTGPRATLGSQRSQPAFTFDLSLCRRAASAGTTGTSGPAGPRPGTEVSAFGLLFRRLARGRPDPGVLALALGGALVLGAYHALTPGHGKTILAAYFIGSRGTPAQAILLGLVTTLTHTSGVFLLGFVTLFASRYVAPERLYPWLSVLSGVMLVGVGASLFWRRIKALQRGHAHTHHHEHHHHDHSHGHAHHIPAGDVRPRDLITLGITGGLLPCPSALIVMLASISVGQIGLGLLLITAFSVGLAGVLTVGGMLMVYARSFMVRLLGQENADRSPAGRLFFLRLAIQRLPVVSAAAVALIGLAIIVRTIGSMGLVR